jgi:flagellar hook-basal body complex protein FliE
MIDGVSALSAARIKTAAEAIPTPAAGAASSAAGPSFAQTLSQFASDAIGTLQAGESAAIQGLQGSMSPFKVVESVMAAQRTLQEALSIRDKAVSAYQEISRMAI